MRDLAREWEGLLQAAFPLATRSRQSTRPPPVSFGGGFHYISLSLEELEMIACHYCGKNVEDSPNAVHSAGDYDPYCNTACMNAHSKAVMEDRTPPAKQTVSIRCTGCGAECDDNPRAVYTAGDYDPFCSSSCRDRHLRDSWL